MSNIPNIENNNISELFETNIDFNTYTKVSLKSIKDLGVAFAPIAGQFIKASMQSETLYRVNMRGYKGNLAKLKDGSGLITTVVKKGKGIQGQASLTEANPIMLNPEIVAVSIAMQSINKKLDSIEKKIDDLKKDMDIEKESNIKGNQITLMEIFSSLKDCWDNSIQKQSFHNLIMTIKKETNKDIVYYQEQVGKIIENTKKHPFALVN